MIRIAPYRHRWQAFLNMNQSPTLSQAFKQLNHDALPQFESALNQSISYALSDGRCHLSNAIHYAVTAPGKRIRPLICMATEHVWTQHMNKSIPIAIAIELLHCYSLIHDDLPAMDNDDFRRGQPTCHKKYGESTAILAGDTLNTYTFEYLSQELPKITPPQTALNIIHYLAKQCGIYGMAGGQMMDLMASQSTPHTLEQLKTIHALKTGAILDACFVLPTMLHTNDAPTIDAMQTIGQHFGLLFQIIDDILDETASFGDIGKTPGKDIDQNKLTYPALLGQKKAMESAEYHYETGLNAIRALHGKNGIMLESIFNATLAKGQQHA